MIDAQRVDFIAVPTKDVQKAAEPLPLGSIALRVPDVADARAKLVEAGMEIVGESSDSGVCHGVGLRDPDGNGLMLHHRYKPYPDGFLP